MVWGSEIRDTEKTSRVYGTKRHPSFFVYYSKTEPPLALPITSVPDPDPHVFDPP
jgi:hypothetical protein